LRAQYLLQEGQKDRAISCAIDRHGADNALAARSTSVQSRHRDVETAFIDKDKLCGSQRRQIRRQAARKAWTRGVSCSLACSDFFYAVSRVAVASGKP
jgi:hypothetical protein